MKAAHVEAMFPRLHREGYCVQSPVSRKYNCIAWAFDDTSRPWWPDKDLLSPYYWPPGIPRDVTVESFTRAFREHGYVVCKSSKLEPGIEKVALYAAADGTPTHAARQLKSGAWVSKLGDYEDIEHETLTGLHGHHYGKVIRIFRRKRQT